MSETKKVEVSFMDPCSVVNELGLKESMSVADFGSGAGHFALMLAKCVGRDGKVFAIDLRQDVLEVLAGYVKLRGLPYIKLIKGDLEQVNGSTLKEGSQDMVLCSNILHQVSHPSKVIEEAMRVLKKLGRLAVIDWSLDAKFGPACKISQKEIEKLATEAGFEKEKEIRAGNQHYGLIFKKR